MRVMWWNISMKGREEFLEIKDGQLIRTALGSDGPGCHTPWCMNILQNIKITKKSWQEDWKPYEYAV